MFRKALKIAAGFTFPIVMSRKTVAGDCSSSIGTFVVINKEGWIVTAAHILSKWVELQTGVTATKAALAERAAVNADASLSKKEKAQRLSRGTQVAKDDSDECSLWLARFPSSLVKMQFYQPKIPGWGEVIDLAVAKLDPFDPSQVSNYPVFKDPTKDFEPGTSLCKLGFPFHQFRPTWDVTNGRFELPPGALPMPRFPIEGIFTRISEVSFEGPEKPPFPVRYVETSSPGLLGQSGGPTFDVNGCIWAIQAKTSHMELGFAGQNQYFNVGLGVHPDTMFPLFKDAGITYEMSDY